MAVAQGSCPSCGSPIAFGVGSSIALVCPYCRATVLRTDRGLQNLGKVADLAHTPSLIAVGDQGTLAGRPFMVMGRVQLDHGAGPWDEYYVAFDYGQAWGWLAYAQGNWYVTSYAPGIAVPAYSAIGLEQDVPLGPTQFRAAEIKQGTVRSAEGELPGTFPAGLVRHYVDLQGAGGAFATIDYGDGSGPATVFLGWMFAETQMQVTQLGPRSAHKLKLEQIKCPACGGDLPKLSGDRAERLGCPYCGAVSDIAAQQVIEQQEKLMQTPDVPIGAKGTLNGVEYVCIAYVRRGSDFDGEHFSWEEYLLWSQPVGFRWLVADPESGWSFVTPVNLPEVELPRPNASWGGKTYVPRNQNRAVVEYVLGEVYWKCRIGETTQVADYVHKHEVLSREATDSEVYWSHSAPLAWSSIASAFGLPPDGPGKRIGAGPKGGGKCGVIAVVLLLVVLWVLLSALEECDDPAYTSPSGVRTGSGIFVGGK